MRQILTTQRIWDKSASAKMWEESLLKVIFHEKHGNVAKKPGSQDAIASLSRSQSFQVKGSGKEDLFPNRAFSFAVVAILSSAAG